MVEIKKTLIDDIKWLYRVFPKNVWDLDNGTGYYKLIKHYEELDKKHKTVAIKTTNNGNITAPVKLFGGFENPEQPTSTNFFVDKTINVGDLPRDMVFSPFTENIYSSDGNDDIVTIINSNNEVEGTIDLSGDNPQDFAFNEKNNKIYLTSDLNNLIILIDTDDTIDTKLSTLPGTRPVGIVYVPSKENIYFTLANNDTVVELNSDTDTDDDSFSVGDFPVGLAYNPNLDRLYVANNGDNTMTVVDVSDNSIVTTINLDGAPFRVAYSSKTDRVYVTLNTLDRVDSINPNNNQVVNNIPVGNNPQYIKFFEDLGRVYVGNRDDGSVSVIDENEEVIQTISGVGNNTQGIAFSTVTSQIYVANSGDDTVSVLSESVSSFESNTDYNQLLREITKKPIEIKGLRAFVTGDQINQPIQLVEKSSTGKNYINTIPITPYTNSQNPTVVLDMPDLAGTRFDGNKSIEYDLVAGGSLTLVANYNQFTLDDLKKIDEMNADKCPELRQMEEELKELFKCKDMEEKARCDELDDMDIALSELKRC